MNPDRYLRTFDILNLLVKHKEGLRLTEIKQELGLPVSSVHNAPTLFAFGSANGLPSVITSRTMSGICSERSRA